MLVALRVRDLLIASWETGRLAVERALPAGMEPADLDGSYLVSLVVFRVVGGRLGRLPVLPYSQLNARTYVTWRGEPAVYFLGSRVTAPGLLGRILGAPFRQARLRVQAGSVRAPGLGVSLVYRTGDNSDAGLLGRHELGVFEAHGLRALRIRRGPAEWRSAVVTEPARADILLALGFELHGDPNLLYAEAASFEAEVPPLGLE